MEGSASQCGTLGVIVGQSVEEGNRSEAPARRPQPASVSLSSHSEPGTGARGEARSWPRHPLFKFAEARGFNYGDDWLVKVSLAAISGTSSSK